MKDEANEERSGADVLNHAGVDVSVPFWRLCDPYIPAGVDGSCWFFFTWLLLTLVC